MAFHSETASYPRDFRDARLQPGLSAETGLPAESAETGRRRSARRSRSAATNAIADDGEDSTQGSGSDIGASDNEDEGEEDTHSSPPARRGRPRKPSTPPLDSAVGGVRPCQHLGHSKLVSMFD